MEHMLGPASPHVNRSVAPCQKKSPALVSGGGHKC